MYSIFHNESNSWKILSSEMISNKLYFQTSRYAVRLHAHFKIDNKCLWNFGKLIFLFEISRKDAWKPPLFSLKQLFFVSSLVCLGKKMLFLQIKRLYFCMQFFCDSQGRDVDGSKDCDLQPEPKILGRIGSGSISLIVYCNG